MSAHFDKDGYLKVAYTPKPRSGRGQEASSGASLIQDASGNDITQEITALWVAANSIYNVDDTQLFEMGETVELLENVPTFIELKNYSEVVSRVFTAGGISQLESARLGGDLSLIQKKDGRVYRMGPWKSGVSYAQPVDFSVAVMSENLITLRVAYKSIPAVTEAALGTADFTVAKKDGRWLVEAYAYPEASFAAQGTAFFLPDMSAQQQYNKEYLQPLLLSGLLRRDWSAENYAALLPDPAGNPGSYLIYAFEDIMGQEKMRPLWDQYQGEFPEQVVEEVLLARFPFSAEQLHQLLAFYYKPAEKIYAYEGGRGGGPIECAVTEVVTQRDGSIRIGYLLLTGYYAEAATPEKDAYLDNMSGTLTLKPATDGGYLYWAVDAEALSSAVFE